MFWHRVMKMDDDKLVKKIMVEQKSQPGNHWYRGMVEIALNLNLPTEEEEIIEMTRNEWKTAVRKAIHSNENMIIKEWTNTSKKCKHMTPNCEMKEYLKILKPKDAMTILKCRLGMIEVKTNFKNKYKDTKCKKCGREEDLEHLLSCQTENNISKNNKKYYLDPGRKPKLPNQYG